MFAISLLFRVQQEFDRSGFKIYFCLCFYGTARDFYQLIVPRFLGTAISGQILPRISVLTSIVNHCTPF